MEDTACSPEKKRTASKAFGPAVGGDDDSKKGEAQSKKKSNRFVHQSDSDNKFAETVTTPTLQECVCFLERNKTMRQIIGLLIELEEKEQEVDETNSNYEQMVADESSNNDSVAQEGNETDSCYLYDRSEGCFGESHYEYFRCKEPTVSWRDLTAAGGDDDNLNKTHFGLKEDSSDSENEYDDTDQDDEDDNSVEASLQSDIPTLQELAFMKVSAQFQQDSKTCEQQHQNLLASLLTQTKSNVKKIYRQYQKQLKASPEFAVVSLLESLMTIAKGKLDERSKWQHCEANSCGITIIEDANKRRAEIRRNWLSERQSILDDHSSFLEQHKPRGDDGDVGNVQRLVLCLSPDCRNLFTPNLIPEKKRCIVPGCMSTHVNCGCSTKPCRTCRGYVCNDHMESLAHACSERARRTCGYFSNQGFVKSRYCNRVFFDIPLLRQCNRCETRCCPACSPICMNCFESYCKVCLERDGAHMCADDFDDGDY